MRAAKSQQEDYDQVKEQVSRLRKGGKKALDDLKKKYFARTMEDYDEGAASRIRGHHVSDGAAEGV